MKKLLSLWGKISIFPAGIVPFVPGCPFVVGSPTANRVSVLRKTSPAVN